MTLPIDNKVSFDFFVYKNTLSENIIKSLVGITDKVILQENAKNLDHSHRLAGEMKDGKQSIIPKQFVEPILLSRLKEMAQEYVEALSRGKYKVKEFNPIIYWVISQLNSDYNPLHYHTSTLSGIVYLITSESVEDSNQMQGNLDFAFGDYNPQSLRFNGARTITPKRGDIYIFPSWLLHTVYPTNSDEERRSMSFNIDLKLEYIND